MKIAICGSMAFSEKMLEMQKELGKKHEVLVSKFAKEYAGKSEQEKQRRTIHDKNNNDAIREFCEKIKESDAILVLNYDKKGVKNYIGGNTLIEIGYAHILHKKIFLLNPIPEIDFYKSEIEAVKPIVLNGDISKIK